MCCEVSFHALSQLHGFCGYIATPSPRNNAVNTWQVSISEYTVCLKTRATGMTVFKQKTVIQRFFTRTHHMSKRQNMSQDKISERPAAMIVIYQAVGSMERSLCLCPCYDMTETKGTNFVFSSISWRQSRARRPLTKLTRTPHNTYLGTTVQHARQSWLGS